MPLPHFPQSLVSGPTPLKLLASFPSGNELWLKDDGSTALPYGGNKVRKLEQILPHAAQCGAKRIVTFGAAGSHHALATAVYAKQFGFKTAAILTPQAWSSHAEQTLRAALDQGLEAHAAPHLAAVIPGWLRIRRSGDYWMAPGALGARGSSGYLHAVDELIAQVDAMSVAMPTRLVLAVGSGSTIAGLLVGLAARELDCQLVGVSVAHNPGLRAQILAQAWALSVQLGLSYLSIARLSTRLSLITNLVGPGYGRPTEETALAQQFAKQFELELDITYTARAFAQALREANDSASFKRRERILYWHTLSTAPMAPLLKSAPIADQIPIQLNRLLVRSGAGSRD